MSDKRKCELRAVERRIEQAGKRLSAMSASHAALLFPPDLVAESVEVLRDCMRATRSQWSQARKDFIEVPDHRVRGEAARTLLAYGIGQPVQRVLTATPKTESPEELQERLFQSPAVRASLRSLLDDYEADLRAQNSGEPERG